MTDVLLRGDEDTDRHKGKTMRRHREEKVAIYKPR